MVQRTLRQVFMFRCRWIVKVGVGFDYERGWVKSLG